VPIDSVSGACGSDTCRLGRLDERVAVFGVSAGWRILALVLLALIVTELSKVSRWQIPGKMAGHAA